jgi:hypothetical protein
VRERGRKYHEARGGRPRSGPGEAYLERFFAAERGGMEMGGADLRLAVRKVGWRGSPFYTSSSQSSETSVMMYVG